MGSRENNQVFPLQPQSGGNAFFDMMGSSTNPESHQLQVDYTRKEPLRSNQPRPPPTPTSGVPQSAPQSMANALPPSAPASPPTPAPSPTPYSRPRSWQQDEKDYIFNDFKQTFSRSSVAQQKLWLEALVDVCDIQLLSFVHQTISPRLKKDPFLVLPIELSYKILHFVEDPKTLVRASQVSRRWMEVATDEQVWKKLYEKHRNRRASADNSASSCPTPSLNRAGFTANIRDSPSELPPNEDYLRAGQALESMGRSRIPFPSSAVSPPTYRSKFKHNYLVESAWRKGGRMTTTHITPDQGVVTSLHLTKKYIVVALDNAKIHVFSTSGQMMRTLSGHVMGVWAMVPWGDTLVSGGCDREVRVWDMTTGKNKHILRGHTSTVRCLKMSDEFTAVSGSRDTSIRVWDITTGQCKHVLVGHQASVRCLEIHGDTIISGSYDTTARIWSLKDGSCLRTLQGHFSQIYAVAFDGKRVATGSLDTSVRIWDPNDGTCLAILQGHTSLVGQLQMRGPRLVTGGSDGSVRVWSLTTYEPIHRLAAHDNSVTSLQFDDSRIVSGGSDGRVKIWDLKTGVLVRELTQPAEAVWRVAFEEERAVVLASRLGRTVMEVWDFAPEEGQGGDTSSLMSRENSSSGIVKDALVESPSRSLLDPAAHPFVLSGAEDVPMTEAGEGVREPSIKSPRASVRALRREERKRRRERFGVDDEVGQGASSSGHAAHEEVLSGQPMERQEHELGIGFDESVEEGEAEAEGEDVTMAIAD